MLFSVSDVSAISVSQVRSNMKKAIENAPTLTIIKADTKTITSHSNNDDDSNSKEEKLYEELVPVLTVADKKSLNQSLASKSSGSKFVDDVEDYIELTNFDDLSFDDSQMTAIIDKEENITFTQDNNSSNAMPDKFSIVASGDTKDELTYTDGGNMCTFKIEYPTGDEGASASEDADDGERKQFACRHCGKQYRWKSTLRRHENVECGGKAPSYECPYCDYKAKQRGNLGVHVRKHHSEMPQLETSRRRRR